MFREQWLPVKQQKGVSAKDVANNLSAIAEHHESPQTAVDLLLALVDKDSAIHKSNVDSLRLKISEALKKQKIQ